MTARIPIQDRPRFARKLVAVWRLHHLARGEELGVVVWPGEWPDDAPKQVAGADVAEWEFGGPGGVFVLGRVGTLWKGLYQIAHPLIEDMNPDDLAITCAYIEVDRNNPDLKLWLHPDPRTGEVPMWSIRRDKAR